MGARAISITTLADSVVRADHFNFRWFRLSHRFLCSTFFLFQLFFSIFRHPKACLDPLLFGNFAHHTELLIFHIKNRLRIRLLIRLQPLHPYTILSVLRLSYAHLNSIKLFNLLDNFVLILASFCDLEPA